MQKYLIIIGAGAHAKTVLETVKMQGIYVVKGFCADKMAIGEKVFSDYSILDNAMLSNLIEDESVSFIVAIGDNKARQLFFENALKKFIPAIVIHPKASISSSAFIGEGTVVLANAVINSSSNVGENSIVNAGVIIDHDCKIGSHTHLTIGTMVGSNSEISDCHKTPIGCRIESFSKITNV